MVQALLIEAIGKVIKKLRGEMDVKEVHLEHPGQEEHGDYSTNIALVVFGKLKTKNLKLETNFASARELAEQVVELLRKDEKVDKLIEKIEVAGPGFINFRVKKEFFVVELGKIVERKERYGSNDEGKERKVVIEYSSPNIAKPFGIGHLRSTVIGDTVGNLLEFSGWKVYRDNHLGDWGTQFGKQIYAIKSWGDEDQIENSESPVKELVDLYIKFHEEAEKNPQLEEEGRAWFKKLEDGDAEARRWWQKCIDWSWKEFDRIYDELGVEFTENEGRGYGESFFEDKMGPVIEELDEKGLLKESKGAKLVFFPNDEYPPLMIIKNDGSTLYATRDLAADRFRLGHYGEDVLIINEVGAEQSLYFQQLFKVEEMLGWVKSNQRIHIKHGHFRFKDKKMSTRKGDVIWLDVVINTAIEKAFEIRMKAPINENHIPGAEKMKIDADVAIGALKWNDLKRSSELDVVFDWDEILRMDGNSGPYVQYTYARTRSVLEKSEIQNPKSETNSNDKNSKQLKKLENLNLDIVSKFDIRDSDLNAEEVSVLRWIYRFPEVVEMAAREYAPNLVCTFLFELAQRYNSFYNKHSILGLAKEIRNPKSEIRNNSEIQNSNNKNQVSLEVREFRLLMTEAVGQVLKNGLGLLGIKAPERM